MVMTHGKFVVPFEGILHSRRALNNSFRNLFMELVTYQVLALVLDNI